MTFKPIKSALESLVYPDGWDSQPVTIERNESKPVEIQYERKWVALLTEPNRESKAYDWLKKLSVASFTEAYWPHYMRCVAVGPRRAQAHQARSLFPGMMFASIAIGNLNGYRPFAEFEKTPGIRGYLRGGQGYPAYMSHADMVRISEIEQDQNRPAEPMKTPTFKPGDKVKIINDLMNAWPAGTIARLNGDGSYNVEIPGLFGQATTIRLFANQVEVV